ncbi:pyrroline-5-carboxylate reductase [Altererythrobacter sp. MF3-039]|uniref:pyrroline-5-carboxylate reductase n=1 Tax=Altererythrobacter sp. MF3-039 TaxID=3252901 RepID=UPI00390C4D18
MSQFEKILIVGLGNMAGAMLDGWLASGLDPACFVAVDPARDSAPEGVRLLRDLPRHEQFDCILLGVKPQLLDEVSGGLESLSRDATMISILAGTELSTLRTHFPRAAAIARVMPNLAAALRMSATTLYCERADEAGRAGIDDLIGRLGATEWLEREDQFHAVTALAGSGPGFVYRFIETLAKAGEELGIPSEQAERLAKQMIEGASALAARSDHSPAELAQRVASPGGTTQAGLDVLDAEGALQALTTECLRAAHDRSIEMAENSKKNG